MKILKIALGLSLILTFLPNQVVQAQENVMTARFLEIPYTPKPGEFRYAGDPAFSIEYIGGEALSASNCSEIDRDFSVVWKIGDRTLAQSLSRVSGYSHTIGITKQGIQCAYLFVGSGLYSPDVYGQALYSFRAEESKVDLTLTLYKGLTVVTSSNGLLLNPNYSAASPQIVGLSRGDVVAGSAVFKVSNSDGSSLSLGDPIITLCEVNTNYCEAGWAKAQEDGSFLLITNDNYSGKSVLLKVVYSYRNGAGYIVNPSTSVIITIGQSSKLIPWEYVKLFTDALAVYPNFKCAGNMYKDKSIECTLNPKVVSKNSDGSTPALNTSLDFSIATQLDTQNWQLGASVKAPTGTVTKFTVPIPEGKWNRLQLKIGNDSIAQLQGSTLMTYGDLPVGPAIKLQFPNFVLWNKPYVIKATSTLGKLSSCAFSTGFTKLGQVKAVNGLAKITVTSVWNGIPGSTTELYFSASCIVSGKTVSGLGYVKGYR